MLSQGMSECWWFSQWKVLSGAMVGLKAGVVVGERRTRAKGRQNEYVPGPPSQKLK